MTDMAKTGSSSPHIISPAGGLRAGRLSLVEMISQSVANISPTFTPALNIVVVATLAGPATWFVYLLATCGLLLVAANIAGLARRHPLAGSYFVYIGRNLGPGVGVLAGWIMIGTYICTAATVIICGTIFLDDLLDAAGLARFAPPHWLFEMLFSAGIARSAWRDVRFSSRIGLALEGASVVIIIVIVAIAVAATGRIADVEQVAPKAFQFGPIASALTFAVFSFVGFESAATLAKEAHDPQRTVPRTLLLSIALSGLFFVVTAYFIRLVVGDMTATTQPFLVMTQRAHLAWAAAIIYFGALISAFACTLASVNAAARLIFSMGRYGFLHRTAGAVHADHGTPHHAIGGAITLAAALALALLPVGLLDGYTYVATITAFGFLTIYLLISIAAPIDARRHGAPWRWSAANGLLSAVLIGFVIIGTVYPLPTYPLNLLPWIFAAYVVVGFGWCRILAARAPHRLSSLQSDMEE